MIRILITTIFVLQIFAQIDPPVWPPVWRQALVQGYPNSTHRSAGTHWYDATHSVARVDIHHPVFDQFCNNVYVNVSAPCTHLYANNRFYIMHMQHRYCCECCDYAHGCKPYARDWLKGAKFEGEEDISGQKFYKWSTQIDNQTVTYYATETDQRIPRRTVYPNRFIDWIMNTYSTDPISPDTFAVPPYCNITCPSTTICGKYRTERIESE